MRNAIVRIPGLIQKLIDQGAAYFCLWGPDCERMHDLIDEVEALREGLVSHVLSGRCIVTDIVIGRLQTFWTCTTLRSAK